jgi:hypothetical protein
VERKRVPDLILPDAERLERLLFSGHDPYFEGAMGKRYAVDRGSSGAWRFVGREPVGDNFRVARVSPKTPRSMPFTTFNE